MNRLVVMSLACAGALAVPLFAAGLKSGPQVGDGIPGVFHPLNVTGPDAGKHECLV